VRIEGDDHALAPTLCGQILKLVQNKLMAGMHTVK
jgi:hypothetical protein